MADGREAVEDLHDGADGHGSGNEADDVGVGGEEEGQLVAEDGEEGDVEEADEEAGAGGDLGAGLGRVDEARADEVGHAGRGGDGDGEGDLEGRRGDGHEDALGREVLGAELARGESQDLKGEPLGLDHDHAWDGETDHGTLIMILGVSYIVSSLLPQRPSLREKGAKEERKEILRQRMVWTYPNSKAHVC